MKPTVKVLCRGTAAKGHSRRELARYSWSEQDGEWVRIDRNASDDMFVSARAQGLQMEARPLFICPCGRPLGRFEYDELQRLLQQAASQGQHLTV